jgi:hypothetical protein
MVLGELKWAAAYPYYDGLTLACGDKIEQQAERDHQISSLFPNYVKFWKLHICPATNRPHSIAWRPGISDIVSAVGQRSHGVLKDLRNGLDYLRMVKAGNLGPDDRNVDTALLYAGNALQKL